MRHTTAAAALIAVLVLAFSARTEASPLRHVSPHNEFSFRVESFGRTLPIHTHRGTSYVEGVKGQSYQVRVFNHTGGRVEAVVTVDGRDVVSGQYGDYRTARGYVIPPYGSVLIDGFRKSWNNVAAFHFTDVDDSYAARMGDASNVGVIGVAVFKEKGYRRPYHPPIAMDRARRSSSGAEAGSGYKAPSAKKSAPSYSAEAERPEESTQGLGTGWGQDTYSPATSTKFTRARRRPDSILAVRYDDRYGLIDKGVIVIPPPPRYTPPRPSPDPFPASPPAFAPPPPPRYYWE